MLELLDSVKRWCLTASIPSMMQRQTWMINQQARSRIAHDFAHFRFHIGFIAVDFAFAAGAFLVLEGAFVKALDGVVFELLAFGAELSVGYMVVPFAVDVNHVADGFLFTYHSFMSWVWWLRLHNLIS